jgi:hypothetical protein
MTALQRRTDLRSDRNAHTPDPTGHQCNQSETRAGHHALSGNPLRPGGTAVTMGRKRPRQGSVCTFIADGSPPGQIKCTAWAWPERIPTARGTVLISVSLRERRHGQQTTGCALNSLRNQSRGLPFNGEKAHPMPDFQRHLPR